MGLDVRFSRKEAIAAGIVIATMRNGSDEDIAIEQANPDCDPDYLAWLMHSDEVIQVPGTQSFVDSNSCPEEEDIYVRANKWGNVYTPLTKWLAANNIAWEEF
jgi:hypothetical protein